MAELEHRSGRETRLLGLVIVVALAALLLLARFRFPASDMTMVTPAQGPLERLAARSTYEDLAASVANLVQRVSPGVVVFELQSIPPPPVKPSPREKPTPPPPLVSRLIAGIRVGDDLAIVHVPRGFQVIAGQGLAAPVQVVATDDARELALVRAPSVLEIANGLSNAAPFEGFSYVGIVEAAIGGVTAKPLFVGRTDPTADGAWPAPILVLGGTTDVPAGSLVFTLDARLIGMAIPFDSTRHAVIPPAVLASIASTLAAVPSPAVDQKPVTTGRGRGGRP